MNLTDVDDRIIKNAVASGNCSTTETAPWIAAFDRGSQYPRHPSGRPLSARHRVHRRDGRPHRASREGRRGLSDRRQLLLPYRRVSGVRQAQRCAGRGPGRPAPAAASTPTTTPRRTSATSRCGRRSGRMRSAGTRASAGASRLAHRVLGDEHGAARRELRHPLRRRRQHLSAPRERDRPVGGGDRQAFVRIWCHSEHLRVGGEKMAKRLGNFATVPDVLEEGATPAALRYLLAARTHYRKPLDYRRAPCRQHHGRATAGVVFPRVQSLHTVE